jgi:prevent-host-death family protein
MSQVSVSELKSRLSHYLREVRRGGEIQILDRGVPIARVTHLPSRQPGGDDSRLERLIQAGVVRPGRGNAAWILDTPPLELSVSILESLNKDREDRF